MTTKKKTNDIQKYLNALKWDGKRRVRDWAVRYLGAPETARECASAWLKQAVARAYEPGCCADYVLVLAGSQGTGKSKALRILGGEHFGEGAPPWDGQDVMTSLMGKWIVELTGLDGQNVAFKTFLCTREDTFRAPYTKSASKHPRTCVFAISVDEPVSAGVGTRRFAPVQVGKIDLKALARDRDQLWAEAVARYQAGASDNMWTADH